MSRLDPGGAIGGEATRSDEEVSVRMILERARPGVKHGKAAEGAADPGAIGGEQLDRSRGLTEKCGVDGRQV
jgi:hypothetical protein